MGIDNIGSLYKSLVDNGIEDIGTEEVFREKLKDDGNRKALYNALRSKGVYDIGSYNVFNEKISEDYRPITDFVPAFNQGMKGIEQGGKFAAGELFGTAVGSQRDYVRATEQLDELVGSGYPLAEFDAGKALEGYKDRDYAKRVEQYKKDREAWKRGFDSRSGWDYVKHAFDGPERPVSPYDNGLVASNKYSVGDEVELTRAYKAIGEALKESGGDVDGAKEILKNKSKDERWGDKATKEAGKVLNGFKPTEGWAAMFGSLMPQMLGQAAAIGASVFPATRWMARPLAKANMAALAASSAGGAMHDAREYGASTGDVMRAGSLAAAIEYGTEMIPYDRYFGGIQNQVRSKLGKEIVSSITRNDVAKKELSSLIMKAGKALPGKFLNKKGMLNFAGDVALEGLSEFLAEGGGAMVPMIYANKEDYPTLAEILDQGWEGAKAGFLMGGILGGASNTVGYYANRNRRKNQGRVALADTDNGVMEVVGKNGNTYSVVDGNGNTSEVDRDAIKDYAVVGFDEFDTYAKKQTADNLQKAVDSGRRLEFDDSMDIYKAVLGEIDPERAKELLDVNDVTGYLEDHEDESGMLETFFTAKAQAVGAATGMFEGKRNKKDGSISLGVDADGKRVFVLDETSEGKLVEFENGEKKFVPGSSIGNISSMPIEEYANDFIRRIKTPRSGGGIAIGGNALYNGKSVRVQRIEEDGNALVEMEDGRIERVPYNRLVVDDVRNKAVENVSTPVQSVLDSATQEGKSNNPVIENKIPFDKNGAPDYDAMIKSDPGMFASEWEKISTPEDAKERLAIVSQNVEKRIASLEKKNEKSTDFNRIVANKKEIARLKRHKENIDNVLVERYGPKPIEDGTAERVPHDQLPVDNMQNKTAEDASAPAQSASSTATQEIKPSNPVVKSNIPLGKNGKPDYNYMLDTNPELFALEWEKRSTPEKARQALERQSGNIGKKIEALECKLDGETDLNSIASVEDEISSLMNQKKNVDAVVESRYLQKTPDDSVPGFSNEEEMVRWVASESTDVNEIIDTYEAVKRLGGDVLNNIPRWQQELQGKKVDPGSFYRFGDRNQATPQLRKGWLSKEGAGVDQVARDLSEFGVDVSTQDVVDFMINHPAGRVRQPKEELDRLGQRFSEVASDMAGMKIGRPDSPTGRLFVEKIRTSENVEQLRQQMIDVQRGENEALKSLAEQYDAEGVASEGRTESEETRTHDNDIRFRESSKIDDISEKYYVDKNYIPFGGFYLRFTDHPQLDVEHGKSRWYICDLSDEDAIELGYKKDSDSMWYKEHSGLSGHYIDAENLTEAIKIIESKEWWYRNSQKDSWSIFESNDDVLVVNDTPEGDTFAPMKVLYSRNIEGSATQHERGDELADYRFRFMNPNEAGFAYDNIPSEFKDTRSGVINDINFYTDGHFLEGNPITDSKSVHKALEKNIPHAQTSLADHYANELQGIANRRGYKDIKELVDDFDNMPRTTKQDARLLSEAVDRSAVRLGVSHESGKTIESNVSFNKELQQQIEGKLSKGHVYNLGMPGDILKMGGIPNLPIELASSKLLLKSSKDYQNNHPFDLSSVMNLPQALQNPIAIFDSKTRPGSKVIMTELTDSSGNNFVVAMQTNVPKGKHNRTIQVNSIRSLYPKDNVRDVVAWVNRGDLLKYSDKMKLGNWLAQQRSNSADVATPVSELDVATKIVENFENPTVLDGEISSEIDRMGDELGVKINKVRNRNELPDGIRQRMKNGRFPGLYDTKTGKVYAILDEITDVSDAQATVLHEVLGHKGIRGLFGDKLPEFCGKVLDAMPGEERAALIEKFGSEQLAAEEYVAGFAEGYGNPTAWEKVKAIIREFLQNLGIDMKMSDNDLKYILWKAKNSLKDTDTFLDASTKFVADNGVQDALFRRIPKELKSSEEFVAQKRRKIELAKERIVDNAYSLKDMTDFLRGRGIKVRDFEDAYTEALLADSKSFHAINRYQQDFQHPLNEAIVKLMKYGRSFKDVCHYAIAKHAPERNAMIEAKNGFKNGSGMSDEEANAIVQEFEENISKDDIDNLWKRVDAATKFALERQYKDGFISKGLLDHLSGMFQHYVPLKGWEETDGVDYSKSERFFHSSGMKSLEKAKGRGSIADNPFSYIEMAAENAIRRGDLNRVRQCFYNMCVNNPDKKLYTVNKTYYVEKDGEWIVQNERPSEEMFKSGKAKTELVDAPHKELVKKEEEKRYDVDVWMGGEKSTITLAQGERGLDIADAINKARVARPSRMSNVIGWFTRFIASVNTSKNPEFVVRNFERDFLYAVPAYAIKGGNSFKLMANLPKAFKALNDEFMNGSNKKDTELSRYMEEYLNNGGKTGFVHSLNIEGRKKRAEKEIRRMMNSGTKLGKARAVGKAIDSTMSYLGDMSENSIRLAVFITERQSGKTVKEAAIAAKEITVNFNRKGNLTPVLGCYYAFFNASVQGSIHNFIGLGVKWTNRFVGANLILGAIQMMAAQLSRSFEDEDELGVSGYDRLSDYTRNNNIILPDILRLGSLFGWQNEEGKKYGFMTIPMPQSFRAVSSVGIITDQIYRGMKSVPQGVMEIIDNMVANMSPLDLEFYNFSSGNPSMFLARSMPTVVQPFVDIVANEDFAGGQIYKEEFMKDWKGKIPESSLGMKNTNGILVNIAKGANLLANGTTNLNPELQVDEDGGVSRNKFMGWLDWNPAVMEHVIEGITGGGGRFYNNMYKTFEAAFTDKEVDNSDIPFVRTHRTMPHRKTHWEMYFDVRDQVEDVDFVAGVYKKAGNYGTHVRVLTKSNQLNNSVSFRIIESMVNKYRTLANMSTTKEDKETFLAIIDRAVLEWAKGRKGMEQKSEMLHENK